MREREASEINTVWLSFLWKIFILHLPVIHYLDTNLQKCWLTCKYSYMLGKYIYVHLLCFHFRDIGVGNLFLDLQFLLV